MQAIRALLLFSMLCIWPIMPVQAGSFIHGVFAGYETNIDTANTPMRRDGITAVRLWTDIAWSSFGPNEASFEQAVALKSLGYKVTLLLQTSAVPTYQQARAYFDWVQTVPGLKDAVDNWEILNELNNSQYWAGNAQQYVDNVLKAAWDSFHPAGEKVVGASTTAWQADSSGVYGWKTTYNQALVDAGYLNYVDYANVHPYTNTTDEMESWLAAIAPIYGSKPILATEFNFKRMNDWNEWADALKSVYPTIYSTLAGVFYYRLLQSGSEGGWPGLLTTDYQPQQPFYQTWKQLTRYQP